MNRNPTKLPTRQQWIEHIQALTAPVLDQISAMGSEQDRRRYIESFADEYGNRRATDQPFLSYLLHTPTTAKTGLSSLDQQLWWMIQGGTVDASQVIDLIHPIGGLVPSSDEVAIEYRTMVELCALHALWLIATRTDSDQLKERCLNAAAWHTQELQPDNGINRPWATQVFIELSLRSNDPETIHLAHLHTQTLIHNSSVSLGAPDILSAWILKDAAEQLRVDQD